MNLKNFLQAPQLRQFSKGALALLFVITAIGFIDATYLTVEHYVNAIPPCSIGSCEQVLTSQYSSVFGVPVSLFGALYYFVVLVLLKSYFDNKRNEPLMLAGSVITLGAIVSIALICIMAFVLHAYCVYCLFSDILTIILCAVFWIMYKKYRTPVTTI